MHPMHLNTLLHTIVDKLSHHSESAADELHAAVDQAVPAPDPEPAPEDAPAEIKTPTNPKG